MSDRRVAIWADRLDKLQTLARRQLFFIGGAPRSGTTWLQYLLDSHPRVSCRGEGLFMRHLAEPLDKMMNERRRAVESKNNTVFRDLDGYPLPEPDDIDFVLRTAILLALEQQCAHKPCQAVGEKTPENVFFFPRLKRLFPTAMFICMTRDPRDVLSSSWHFFHKPKAFEDEQAAKTALVRQALPSMQAAARATLALKEQYPSDCLIVSYEGMRAAPAATAARLFRFLGVSDDDDVVARCVERTSFSALSGGREAGAAKDGSFFRKGIVGDWRSTLTPEMNEMILRELGPLFQHFGWQP
jgi:Sulfotransferase family